MSHKPAPLDSSLPSGPTPTSKMPSQNFPNTLPSYRKAYRELQIEHAADHRSWEIEKRDFIQRIEILNEMVRAKEEENRDLKVLLRERYDDTENDGDVDDDNDESEKKTWGASEESGAGVMLGKMMSQGELKRSVVCGSEDERDKKRLQTGIPVDEEFTTKFPSGKGVSPELGKSPDETDKVAAESADHSTRFAQFSDGQKGHKLDGDGFDGFVAKITLHEEIKPTTTLNHVPMHGMSLCQPIRVEAFVASTIDSSDDFNAELNSVLGDPLEPLQRQRELAEKQEDSRIRAEFGAPGPVNFIQARIQGRGVAHSAPVKAMGGLCLADEKPKLKIDPTAPAFVPISTQVGLHISVPTSPVDSRKLSFNFEKSQTQGKLFDSIQKNLGAFRISPQGTQKTESVATLAAKDQLIEVSEPKGLVPPRWSHFSSSELKVKPAFQQPVAQPPADRHLSKSSNPMVSMEPLTPTPISPLRNDTPTPDLNRIPQGSLSAQNAARTSTPKPIQPTQNAPRFASMPSQPIADLGQGRAIREVSFRRIPANTSLLSIFEILSGGLIDKVKINRAENEVRVFFVDPEAAVRCHQNLLAKGVWLPGSHPGEGIGPKNHVQCKLNSFLWTPDSRPMSTSMRKLVDEGLTRVLWMLDIKERIPADAVAHDIMTGFPQGTEPMDAFEQIDIRGTVAELRFSSLKFCYFARQLLLSHPNYTGVKFIFGPDPCGEPGDRPPRLVPRRFFPFRPNYTAWDPDADISAEEAGESEATSPVAIKPKNQSAPKDNDTQVSTEWITNFKHVPPVDVGRNPALPPYPAPTSLRTITPAVFRKLEALEQQPSYHNPVKPPFITASGRNMKIVQPQPKLVFNNPRPSERLKYPPPPPPFCNDDRFVFTAGSYPKPHPAPAVPTGQHWATGTAHAAQAYRQSRINKRDGGASSPPTPELPPIALVGDMQAKEKQIQDPFNAPPDGSDNFYARTVHVTNIPPGTTLATFLHQVRGGQIDCAHLFNNNTEAFIVFLHAQSAAHYRSILSTPPGVTIDGRKLAFDFNFSHPPEGMRIYSPEKALRKGLTRCIAIEGLALGKTEEWVRAQIVDAMGEGASAGRGVELEKVMVMGVFARVWFASIADASWCWRAIERKGKFLGARLRWERDHCDTN